MIRTLLSDLDDTLFDHAGSTRDALARVREHAPAFGCWSLDDFDRRHRDVLEHLHLEVLAGRRTVEEARVERFRRLLLDAGVDERRAHVLDELSGAYRRAYEESWRMVDGAVELVAAAKAAGWRVAIVTNNVAKEQKLKVARGGLLPHVDVLVTSEEFGATKPDPRIIHHAIERVGATRETSVMFGDSLVTDIAAARAAGVRAVWFNRWHQPAAVGLPELRTLAPAPAALATLCGEPASR